VLITSSSGVDWSTEYNFRFVDSWYTNNWCRCFKFTNYSQIYVDETRVHEETNTPEVTSRKKKSIWFQYTLKESKEYVGETQRLMRESRVSDRFGSHLAMVMNIYRFGAHY
jgi:hypothetical protein